MNITDLVAFLAFVVALYGAVLSTYTAINEFFRLRLSVFNLNESCITLTKSDEYLSEYGEYISTYEKDLYTIIILVRIINKSKNPTTINEIVLNDKYVLNSSSQFDTFIPTKFKCENNNYISYDDKRFTYPILKPLHELQALDTFEGYLIFNNISELPSKFDIKVKAVQKTKTFHLNLNIANDYRNEIIQE